jgi:hypothetical protein
MMKCLIPLLLCGATLATAQPLTPFYRWELAPTPSDLSAAPAADDLVQAFPEVYVDGVLSDQVINESGFGEFGGLIDSDHNVVSYLTPASQCLQLTATPSDGFAPGLGNDTSDLLNGQLNGPLDGVLRDAAFASLVIRFGFATPTDIGTLRVIGGYFEADGRTFHHYDVWASTDGQGHYGDFFLVAAGVKSGQLGLVNNFQWAGSLTELHDYNSKSLATGVTDLRIVFYCPADDDARFVDQWQGLGNETPQYQAECGGAPTDTEDTDGYRRGFRASVLREVDVFAPGPHTPWVDIDYDHDSDLVDVARFQHCFAGSTTQNGCYRYDLDENADIDAADIDPVLAYLTGPA